MLKKYIGLSIILLFSYQYGCAAYTNASVHNNTDTYASVWVYGTGQGLIPHTVSPHGIIDIYIPVDITSTVRVYKCMDNTSKCNKKLEEFDFDAIPYHDSGRVWFGYLRYVANDYKYAYLGGNNFSINNS